LLLFVVLDDAAVAATAKRIVTNPCCKRHCLKSIPRDASLVIATGCLAELRGMKFTEKKIYLLEKVRSCVKTEHDSGYVSFCWKVGASPAPTASNVCRKCFMACYDCSHGYIDAIVRDMKDGVRCYEKSSSDNTARVNLNFAAHLEQLAAHHGVNLTRQQIQAMTVPNTVESLSAFAWMQNYFNAVGEHQPKVDEIHLDPCVVSHIWEEYKQTLEDAGQVTEIFYDYLHGQCINILIFQDTLECCTFQDLWRQCFPHVKVREYKAVTGKCQTCTSLSAAKRQKLDMATRRYLNELTSLHRCFYMGERVMYYSRRNDAILTPSLFMSIIADGMQQSHCLLPWLANLYQYSPYLPQHLQGVINHGHQIIVYRTFHNVVHNANLSLHCLLTALDNVFQIEHRIPDIVYYQVDGGSENIADHVFGICGLLIARGLTKNCHYRATLMRILIRSLRLPGSVSGTALFLHQVRIKVLLS
jgi:hypothetical protein